MNRLFGMDSPLMVALMKIGDLLCLSVLWLVFSLPIFTIGASSTALYAAVFYCLRRNEAGVWKHFWKAFRENFKRSTLAWLIELAVLAVFSLDAAVFRAIRLSGGAMGKLYWAALLLEAVALTWTQRHGRGYPALWPCAPAPAPHSGAGRHAADPGGTCPVPAGAVHGALCPGGRLPGLLLQPRTGLPPPYAAGGSGKGGRAGRARSTEQGLKKRGKHFPRVCEQSGNTTKKRMLT